ncbi:MAG: branched-chain amino acid ABC transporter permease, partial [Geminicoccaceae bacterium]
MDNLQILIQAPIFSVQLLIDGLLVGAIFALVAYGMALVWGVMNIINVAQGELVMLGGYVTLMLYQAGWSPFLGIPVAAVVMYMVGLGLYRVVIWRIVDRDLFISLLATFGLSILIQQLANQVFGANVETARSGLGTISLFGGNVTVAEIKLLAFVAAFVVAG